MSLETTQIQDKLVETFGESVFHFNQEKDIFSILLFLSQEKNKRPSVAI